LEIAASFGIDEQTGKNLLSEWEELERMQLLDVFIGNTQAAKELLELFHGEYADSRLIDLPKRGALADIESFRLQQERYRDLVVKRFAEEWNLRVLQIVREEVDANPELEEKSMGHAHLADEQGGAQPRLASCTKLELFHDSVAVLCSLQLRHCVQQSLEDYVAFLKKFSQSTSPQSTSPDTPPSRPTPLTVHEVLALGDEDKWEESFLLNKLTADAKGERIKFRNPLESVQEKLLRVFRELVTCMNSMQRADVQIQESPEERCLLPVLHEEADIVRQYREIEEIVAVNIGNVREAIHLYDDFLFLLAEQQRVTQPFTDLELKGFFFEADLAKKAAEKDEKKGGKKKAEKEPVRKSREDYEEYVLKLRAAMEHMQQHFPGLIRMRMITLDCREINDMLCHSCKACIDLLLESMVCKITDRNNKLQKRFEYIESRLSRKATTEEGLVEIETDLDDFRRNDVPLLLEEYQDIKLWHQTALSLEASLSANDYKALYESSRWTKYTDRLNERQQELDNERDNIEDAFLRERTKFQEWLESVDKKVEKFKDYGNIRQCDEYLEKIQMVKDLFVQVDEKAEEIANKEDMLGWDITEFELLGTMKQKLEPFENLWLTCRDHNKQYQQWFKGSLFQIDAESAESEAAKMWRTAYKLQALFKDGDTAAAGPFEVAKKIKEELDYFKEKVPVLTALCNKGLKERHWEKISEIVGFQIEPDNSFTLTRVLDMDIEKYVKELEDISESASKEFQIEKSLDTQEEEWAPVIADFKPWKDTGTYILAGSTVEAVQGLLDDHIIKVQTMKGSPFAKYFAERMRDWEEFLITVQDIIDIWLKVQSVWLYLEPIFSSEDIMKQMPVEGKKFRDVDKTWREVMEEALADPPATTVFRIEGLLERLQDCHQKLEDVQKGLNDYLETKRLYFPRFFFLSNDNLLEILSETKDPTRIQPHMKKCFEGIQSVVFDEKKRITGMVAPEKEIVPLQKHEDKAGKGDVTGKMKQFMVEPAKARGNVEVWLVEMEDAMNDAIRAVTFASKDDYPTKKFAEWLQLWPGMTVIGVFSMFWTQEVQNGLEAKGNEFFVDYGVLMKNTLKEIIDLVRGDVAKVVRCTLEALIVIYVHNQDTVDQLHEMGISSNNDFDWLVQLRYFAEPNPDRGDRPDIFVRISNSHLGYAYEYLGNNSRLVVTPLTDRCYRTCCGALHLGYGAAPEGPAGTGKTETVKDLAKALARFCVVFNCSDGLDYIAMGKFFKGLAASGGWACFDEFNRIDVEVLSVVAQQIMSIQNAIKARKTHFDFEGTYLPIKWTANSFITMNPGYAGRAELPDNLKALFRTVAMMVPDYAMIAEIKLYAYGYEDSRSLAQKIVTTYKLCSEQLSSQVHYDYGMRAVFSVLVAAGNLKRKRPGESESVLMLQSINDVNLAKFLAFDVPLFGGIKSDLFPGVELPTPDYSKLIDAVSYHLQKDACKPDEYFLTKVIQFYETHIVRHSLMIVGLPYSGKTTQVLTLQKALTDLANSGDMHPGEVVHQLRLNAKSIPPRDLYGCFDEVSHEWTDGVVPVLFREFARNQTDERKWLVFDGPVDAIWIEDMNTVMDENKKLCLTSGEIIAMSPNMRVVIEPMDVEVASPATISRNGMVYCEPHLMGFQHLVDKFIAQGLPSFMTDAEQSEVVEMTNWLLPPCIKYVKAQCAVVSPSLDQNLVQSFLLLYMSLIRDALEHENFVKNESNISATEIASKNIITMIDCYAIFAITFSCGAACTTESKPLFSKFLQKLLANQVDDAKAFKKVNPPLPDRGLVFDFMWDMDSLNWKGWMETVPDQQIPNTAQAHTLLIQTTDSVRYQHIIRHCIAHEIKLLFCGPTGTGKTAYMEQQLLAMDKDSYMPIFVGFSAKSRCAQVQDLIDAKLDRRRKGVFGPAMNRKALIMIDDLNMPVKEKYGAQPPIEILRQMIDKIAYPPNGGWYDRKDSTHPFRGIVDCIVFAAMGLPGGGRTFITPRFASHFLLIGFPNLDDENMAKIFQTIVDWKFGVEGYPGDVTANAKKIVLGTLEMYKAAVANLLPTPLKVHYTFNLRDFSKIVLGFLQMDKDGFGEDAGNRSIRLWVHECWRIMGDRLVIEEDRKWMLDEIREITKRSFGKSFDEVMKPYDTNKDNKVNTIAELRYMIFGDMLSPPAAPKRPYRECMDFTQLQSTVEAHLDEYNNMTTNKMNLVCFLYMLEHLARVARVVRTPGGNALLVGVGGSGRQSCTKLAAFLADFTVFQIEIAKGYDQLAFREDIKKLLTNSGGKGDSTVFLFTDSQIKDEGFVEDINNLLNSGEVPNLFAPDERMNICELVRPAAKQEGKCLTGAPAELYAYFIGRVKTLMKIVLCFSPIGDSWRARLRQFPSLVNCCVIDWFTEWPQDALTAVADRFLKEEKMDEKTCDSCVEMCSVFHSETTKLAVRFKDELKRMYYATPTSFLELIATFKTLLNQKRKEVSDLKSKYDVGLTKLVQTEGSVEGMKKELIALQPQLIKKNKEVGELMIVVGKETEEAEKVKVVVAADEAVANESAEVANAIKEECEAGLAEAMPALNSALKALDTLTQKDITEIKAMKNPPAPVKLVLTGVCIMKGISAVREPGADGKMAMNYWPSIVKMISDTKFLESLRIFDKDNMDPKVVAKVGGMIDDEDFQVARLEKVSKAATGICMWVRAMVTYDRVAKDIAPKKAKLAVAQGEFDAVMAKLAVKQAELKKIVDKLTALEDQLNGLKQEQDDLAYQVDLCQKKLERAEQLISSLGGEKTRWTASSAVLADDYINLTGDVIVSSGLIAYLGAFTPEFREEAILNWVEITKSKEIPGSETFSLQAILGQPVKIRNWTICGLPNDSFSIENAIILDKARRWPLAIDPQGQANKWIKKMEADRKIAVAKFTDADYLRKLETSIQFGNPYLIENVAEEMDPAVEPVLLKQTFKKGGMTMIKLGESIIEYSKDFFFYLTTKLRNPHYLPDVAVKVTLLNFMITLVGLQDQILNFVVKEERPDLAEEKEKLVLEGAANKKALEDCENEILRVLSESQGNILEDESAINILKESKVIANDIAAKQEVGAATEIKIDEARVTYVPVAFKASVMFFCIQDLANIDPMYQYSLPFYVSLFLNSIERAEKASELDQRIENINDFFRLNLYRNICRSLFERHKLLFSFLLCARLFLADGMIDMANYRYLLTGGVSMEQPPECPAAWIPVRTWAEVFKLGKIADKFQGIEQKFTEDLAIMKQAYDATDPLAKLRELQPKTLEGFDEFEELMFLRALRPDRLVPAIMLYVSGQLGEDFVNPPPFDLAGSFADSNNALPLVFVLSPGSDPKQALDKFAMERGKEIQAISLGQGQGPKAEKLMADGKKDGGWVLLQNCHLATSWMPKLDKMLDQQDVRKIHKEYRLWLTSYPSAQFPVAILQNGLKMTNEAPKGLRSNLTGSFLMSPISDMEFFESCKKPREFKRLLYGLCFFHAVIQERKLFGPLGWNIPYEFTENDLRISVMQLKMFIDEQEQMPFKAIIYMTGECNYGGRVTDGNDRILIMTLLRDYFDPSIFDPEYRMSGEEQYALTENEEYDDICTHIRGLPLVTPPGVFGFHENANLTKEQGETYQMMGDLLKTVGQASGGGGAGPEDLVREVANDILAKLPKPWNIPGVQEKYPVMYEESMNTVLFQEVTRYNKLSNVIRESLKEILRALKGLALLSAQLEEAFFNMFDGKTPVLWLGSSYPSLKPLGGYVADLLERLKFYQTWIDKGKPTLFWISGIFFTQAFTTAASQNFARKFTIPIDTLVFDFYYPKEQKPTKPPADGVYTYGLFLEGARWDWDEWALGESEPKVLFTSVPMVHIIPCTKQDLHEFKHYSCPVYKISTRRGVLSTTGHSTNFVMPMRVPAVHEPKHWVKRGCAMLTSLDV